MILSPWRRIGLVCWYGSPVLYRLARLSFLANLLFAVGLATASPEEQFLVGKGYYDRGDLVAAMPFLRNAADAGHAPAQTLYAWLLNQSDSAEEAAKYYRQAVAQGNADARFGLAAMLLGADGIPADVPEARRLFVQAAEDGHQQAIIVVALAYANGGLGLTVVEREGPVAVRWLAKGAELDHLPSLRRLAQAYRNGEMGLTQDLAEAERLMQKVYKIMKIDPNAPKRRRRNN